MTLRLPPPPSPPRCARKRCTPLIRLQPVRRPQQQQKRLLPGGQQQHQRVPLTWPLALMLESVVGGGRPWCKLMPPTHSLRPRAGGSAALALRPSTHMWRVAHCRAFADTDAVSNGALASASVPAAVLSLLGPRATPPTLPACLPPRGDATGVLSEPWSSSRKLATPVSNVWQRVRAAAGVQRVSYLSYCKQTEHYHYHDRWSMDLVIARLPPEQGVHCEGCGSKVYS